MATGLLHSMKQVRNKLKLVTSPVVFVISLKKCFLLPEEEKVEDEKEGLLE